jgi:YD repeat-containing protein
MLHGIRLRGNHRRFAVTGKILAFAMALNVITAIRNPNVATAAPADIFDIAAPTIGSEAPKAADIKEGDASVSTQTGALQYSFPIPVPPGRNGMQPHLALSYSSQAPIYGGIANGWSLSVPMITLDTTQGRLLYQSSSTPNKIYTSSMAGGRPLVRVSEPHDTDVGETMRAQSDATFTRYERLSSGTAKWRARTTDGLTYIFGDSNNTGTCTIISDEYAPLTTTVDSFGNEVNYFYAAGVDGECLLKTIQWGKNQNAALGDFAAVSFSYSQPGAPTGCPSDLHVGSQTSYRTGTKIVTGASQLDTITAITAEIHFIPGQIEPPTTTVLHTRLITLSYNPPSSPGFTPPPNTTYLPPPPPPTAEQTATCSAHHAAYRTLYSIQESAWGIDSPRVDLPPVTFTYGSAEFGSGNLTWTLTHPTNSQPWPDPVQKFNLAWGYRFNTCASSSPWPTVEAMMLDIDGDSRPDRVVTETSTVNGKTVCGARWYRNKGFDGQGNPVFEDGGHIQLPTLKWGTSQADLSLGHDACYNGSNVPDTTTTGVAHESCSLNYQLTRYKNSTAITMTSCPVDGGTCGGCDDPNTCAPCSASSCPSRFTCSNGTDCKTLKSGPSYLAYRWMDYDGDGKVDIIASPSGSAIYNLQKGTGLGTSCNPAPSEPDIFGAGGFPACPSSSYTADPDPGGGYTMCNGMYPWVVYLNHGSGQFGRVAGGLVPDGIVYQPIPLETDSGDSSLTSRPVGAFSGPIDVDGDGHDDAVHSVYSSPFWDVYRYYRDPTSSGIGKFVPASGSTAFNFLTNDGNTPLNQSTLVPFAASNNSFFVSTPEQEWGFTDLNSDGLVDHFQSTFNSDGTVASTSVHINTGDSIESVFANPSVRPANDGFICPRNDCCSVGGTSCQHGRDIYYVSGERFDSSRTMDLDLDGRADVMQLGRDQNNVPTTNLAQVFFNQGGAFSDFVYAVQDNTPLAHATVVRGSSGVSSTDGSCTGNFNQDWWELRSDFVDLDGDGIPEGVDFGVDAYRNDPQPMNFWRMTTPTQPPRLLSSIDNGRGAVTSTTYASLHDSNAVCQHEDDASCTNSMPHTMWVVRSLTTTDNLPAPGSTTTTTSYFYKNPHFGADDAANEQVRYGFRGFEEVTTTAHSGAKTVQRYSYDPDWSGRLTTTIVMPKPGAPETSVDNEVRSIDDTKWEARGLFCHFDYSEVPPKRVCAIWTFHATEGSHWTCNNGEDEQACRANTDTFTRTVSTTTSLNSTLDVSGPYLWKETSARLTTDSTSTTPQEGDRITDSNYVLAADATNYRLLPASLTKSVISSGTPVVYAHTGHTFDSTNTVAVTDEVWFALPDETEDYRAVTKREYDMTTGNVTKRWKPQQNPDRGGNGAFAQYGYDSRKLFVASETLEAAGIANTSQVIHHKYEFGTGTKLETRGPNIAPCAAPTYIQGCPTGSPPEEDHRIRVDGLGRMIERYETFMDNGGSFYFNLLVETNAYDPSQLLITHQSAIDGALDNPNTPVRYAQDETDLDGHGRPIKKTVFANGAAAADAITTFHYNNEGTLGTVTLPDPSANDTSTVTFSYAFDSLGRPTRIRRPDASSSSQSGVDMSYNGLVTTSTEVVGADGGNAASTTTTKDAFGRLRYVDEQVDSATYARTTYDNDAADNVRQVTDPEGVITSMTHDFAGHRTSITRPNGRTWTYAYNKNGDLISEIVPGYAADRSDIANFMTTI